MRGLRTALALAVLFAGTLGGVPGSFAAEGSHQCYHRVFEALDACSVCANGCMGAGYLCCTIIPG